MPPPQPTPTLTGEAPSAALLAAGLATLDVPLTPEQTVDRLESAARRGKFPGFVRNGGNPLFHVRDFGGPVESVLEARAAASASPHHTRLSFTLRLRPTLLWVYLAVLIVTVWPGVWLTDSMLRTYFPGYRYQTWMWYLPLTVPAVPWAMWSVVHKSRRRGREDAPAVLIRLAETLGVRLEIADPAPPNPAGSAAPASRGGGDAAAPARAG